MMLLAQPVLAKSPKITFLLAETPQDRGWNAAHYRGIEALKAMGTVMETDTGFSVTTPNGKSFQVQIIEQVGYSETDIERIARQAAMGSDMVFGTWFNAALPLARLAEEFPDVIFEHCSGYPMIHNNGKNLSTYFIRQELGDYIAGYVAGLMGYTKVGLVATIPIPEPVRGINGFTLGLQKGLADAGLDPTLAKVRVVWTNAWLTQTGEIMAAEGLIAEGYHLIRQMGDTPYASATACDAGVAAIGYGTDVSGYAPCALMSNEWNWGAYYVSEVRSFLNENWGPQDWWGGFESINLVGWNVPDDVVSKAIALTVAIDMGKVKPFDNIKGTALVNGETQVIQGSCDDMCLLNMQWYVDGVMAEPIPLTEPVMLN